MNNNEKRVVIVSGASSGIGLASVKSLLDLGYAVVAIARHFSDPVKDHPDLRFEQMDLSDLDALPGAIAKLVTSIEQPIAALVNNAGIGKMGYLEQLSVADLRLTMDVNFLSHAIITKALLPGLKQQGSGDIVFIGSEAALRGARQGSVYCASKFALRGFSQALRDECGKSGVRVTLINPGAVRTPFFDSLKFEPGGEPENAIQPEDVARALLMVLQARAGTVFDEINLSPLTHVWQTKS